MLVLGIIGVLALLGAAGATAWFVLGGDDGPSYPDEWAAEVAPFAEFVAEERGIEFERPVHVDFLDDETFRAQVTAEEADLTDEDREMIEQTTGLLRALGLVEGEIDLFDASNDLAGAGIVGYYSYEDKRIRMRGEELTQSSKITLVHELTHALQDQRFDLLSTFERLEEDEDPTAAVGYEAVVEGDAQRVATAYRNTLGETALGRLAEEEETEVQEYEVGLGDVPLVLQTFAGMPYVLGEAMLHLAVEVDGNDAVNRLFLEPPISEEQLFDPWRLLEGDVPAEVAAPTVSGDEEEFDRGTFGAFSFFVVLAERIDMLEALDAADGWGGDSYVAFDRDGAACVRVVYRGDTGPDTDEMSTALQAWIDAADGPASVQRDGDEMVFESCDPGADSVDVAREVSDQALGLAATRTYLASGILQSGANEAQAECFARNLVHRFDVEKLNDPELGSDPGSQRVIQEIAVGCR